MAADSDDRFMWVNVEKKIVPSEWQKHTITHPGGIEEVGFKATIEFQPQSDHQSFIDDNSCCHIYHKKVAFELYLSNLDDSYDLNVKIRLSYIVETEKEKIAFIKQNNASRPARFKHECVEGECTSYIWCFDYCLIKVKFCVSSDEAFKPVICKRFHVECESDKCLSYRMNCHAAAPDYELASFTEKRFMNWENFRDELGFTFSGDDDDDDVSFVPVEIEIRARMFLFPMLHDLHYGSFQFEPPTDNSSCSLQLKHLHLQESDQMPCPKKLRFNSEQECDVSFQIGTGPEPPTLPCCSWILSARSPVFRSMFSTDMKEKTTGIITIGDDVTLEILKLFVCTIYELSGFDFNSNTKKVTQWDVDENIKVLQLAHKYQMEEIVEFCSDNLIGLPNVEYSFKTAIKILKASLLYKIDDLKYRAAQWFKMELHESDADEIKCQLTKLLIRQKDKEIVKFVVDLL